VIISRFLGNVFYSHRALVWAGQVGISCTVDSSGMPLKIFAANISLKVVSLHLKGYTSTLWQFHVAQQQDHWTEASMGINSWIFLQLVWRTVKEEGFTCIHT
jgi:hypothetical protein